MKKSSYDADTDLMFKELHVLKFHDMYLFQLGQVLYSLCSSNLLPEFMEWKWKGNWSGTGVEVEMEVEMEVAVE